MTILSRRTFLAALASLSGSLSPLARCLGATARESDAGKRPQRVVFFLQGNGLYPDELQPPELSLAPEPRTLEDRPLTGLRLPVGLEPLAAFRDQMTIIQGLSGRVTGPPPHSANFGALGCFPHRSGAFGETIDAALAKAVPSVFSHVGLGVSERADDAVIYNVSAWDKGKPLPTQCQPALAYQRFFARSAGGAARQDFDARTGLLDHLASDVRQLEAQLIGAEREKLGHYLQALETMSQRQGQLAAASARLATRGLATADSARLPAGVGGFAHLEAQLDIAASTLIAGLTNVATISSGSGLEFFGIQVDGTDLGLSPGLIPLHAIGHGSSFHGRTWKQLHVAIHRRHSQALAGFLAQLAAVPEGDGSLLDNTLVVVLSDQAEGHHPQCFEWPMLLIGNLGGKLHAGNRFLRYPWYGQPGHRTTASLFATLLHAIGTPRDSFGLRDEQLGALDSGGPLDALLRA